MMGGGEGGGSGGGGGGGEGAGVRARIGSLGKRPKHIQKLLNIYKSL